MEEKVFITERRFAGPRIEAGDWESAEEQARDLGVELVGELCED